MTVRDEHKMGFVCDDYTNGLERASTVLGRQRLTTTLLAVFGSSWGGTTKRRI